MKRLSLAATVLCAACASLAQSNDPAALSDTEMAHVAYTADNIDIRYAHLALAISNSPEVHNFAKTMIRDHNAVNEAALTLLDKLGAQPKDNFLSKDLAEGADKVVDDLAPLRGDEFDRAYAKNELAYHKSVNGLVENTFIPHADHPEVKALFEQGLEIFRVHEGHAAMMVKAVQ